MAKYIPNRCSDTLFVVGSLDTLLPDNSVARTIGEVLSGLDFSRFDEKYRNDQEGRPAVDPRRLAGVWILGILRGVTSSVALAKLCRSDIEMRWMVGDAPVHKSTLCDFRKRHVEELGHLSTQILAAMARSDMLPGKELGLDGTIVRAAASCAACRSRKSLKRSIEKLDKAIEQKLAEADVEQDRCEQLIKRKARLEQAVEEIAQLGVSDDEQRVTITEPQAPLRKLKSGQYAPAHNIEAVNDLEGGAIITTDVVEQGNDQGQLLVQTNNAREQLERVGELLSSDEEVRVGPPGSMVSDGAFHDTLQLVELEQMHIETFVPDGQQNRKPTGVSEQFLAERFEYDAQNDTMICPQGHRLKRKGFNERKTAVKYGAETAVCKACAFKNQCCPKAKRGRSVNRPLYEKVTKAVAERVKSERGKRFKAARSVVLEGGFARMVELLNWRRCRAWGKQGAQAEALWRQITHNLMLLTGRWKPLVLTGSNTG